MSKAKKIKPGLGKGLGALIPNVRFSKDKGFDISEEEIPEGGSFGLIEISKVTKNPYQPRHDFEEEALEDLKKSILEHGVIQPVTLRRVIGGFELIAGERRLRASKEAGLEKIPAYILDIESSVEMLEIALIENVQREDLNPVEIAYGYQTLIEECKLTQEEVAVKVGKDRSTIANFLRLLKLPEKVHESLRKKLITMGHARTLITLNEHSKILAVWKEILDKSLSVRATEELVRNIQDRAFKANPKKSKKEIINEKVRIALDHTEDNLRQVFGTEVRIKPKTPESGLVEFEFYSKEDLDRLLELFYKARE